jgi:hypothetical protein
MNSSELIESSCEVNQQLTLEPELVNFQVIDDADMEHHALSNDVSQFEIVPQTFEVLPQSFAANQDNCIYYTYDPSGNQFGSITWA